MRIPAWTLLVMLQVGVAACANFGKCESDACQSDSKITAQVQALFAQHPALEPPNLLTVQTLKHVVYLNGLVDTDLERQMAETVALEAAGVLKVVNSIGISGNR